MALRLNLRGPEDDSIIPETEISGWKEGKK
jgi:hypothetical protein